jgi:hypothetical protein
MSSKVQKGAAPPNAGKGRKKGVPNKVTGQLKDMICGALSDAGGQAYLTERALDPRTASAFLTLVGKVLPLQVTGADGGAVLIQNVTRTIVRP